MHVTMAINRCRKGRSQAWAAPLRKKQDMHIWASRGRVVAGDESHTWQH